jgi:hypothetical protein
MLWDRRLVWILHWVTSVAPMERQFANVRGTNTPTMESGPPAPFHGAPIFGFLKIGLFYKGLVLALRDGITRTRLSPHESRTVFSYHAEGSSLQFRDADANQITLHSNSYVGMTDIADFYPRHRGEGPFFRRYTPTRREFYGIGDSALGNWPHYML